MVQTNTNGCHLLIFIGLLSYCLSMKSLQTQENDSTLRYQEILNKGVQRRTQTLQTYIHQHITYMLAIYKTAMFVWAFNI